MNDYVVFRWLFDQISFSYNKHMMFKKELQWHHFNGCMSLIKCNHSLESKVFMFDWCQQYPSTRNLT